MVISVHLHTILQRHTPDGPIRFLEVELPEKSTPADLLQALEIKLDPDELLIVVNGRMADGDRVLKEGDTVNLMPALSGG